MIIDIYNHSMKANSLSVVVKYDNYNARFDGTMTVEIDVEALVDAILRIEERSNIRKQQTSAASHSANK